MVIRTLARGLNENGIETHVCTTDDNGPGRLQVTLGQPQTEDGATYWFFPRQSRFYLVSFPLALWLWRHVGEYDLVHIHSVFSFAPTMAALAAKTHRVPYVIRPLGVLNEWGIQNRRRLLKQVSLRFVERPIFRRAALVHFTSEEERLEALHVGIFGRSVVIGNPIDILGRKKDQQEGEFRTRYPELRDKKIILFLSRIDRKKGLDLLFEAFSKLRSIWKDARLVIAGDGNREYIAELTRLAEKLDIASAILWTGFLQGKAKSSALMDANVFVLPSYSENFGNAVVEALGMGVPVIISDRVGIHREITSAEAGLVVPCNSDAICSAIDKVISSSDVSQRLAQNGIAIANGSFSTGSVLQKLMNSYLEVIGSASATGNTTLPKSIRDTTPLGLN